MPSAAPAEEAISVQAKLCVGYCQNKILQAPVSMANSTDSQSRETPSSRASPSCPHTAQMLDSSSSGNQLDYKKSSTPDSTTQQLINPKFDPKIAPHDFSEDYSAAREEKYCARWSLEQWLRKRRILLPV